jgi:chromosome segregation ATPase
MVAAALSRPRPRRTDAEVDALVFPICNQLYVEKEEPQTRTIRPLLIARGETIGPNLVQRSLDRWRQTEKPQPVPAPTEPLPAELARTLIRWISDQREASRQELLTENGLLRTEKEDLLAGLDRRDDEWATLTEQVEVLSSQHSAVGGQLTEVTAERDKLTHELDNARKAAEGLVVKTRELQLLQAERDEFRGELQTERQSRTEAQRQHAVLDETRKRLEEQVADLRKREESVVMDNKQLRARIEALLEELRTGNEKFGLAEGARAVAARALQEASAQLQEAHRQVTELAKLAGAATAAQEGLARAHVDFGACREQLNQCHIDRQRLSTENEGLRAQVGTPAPTSPVSTTSGPPGTE